MLKLKVLTIFLAIFIFSCSKERIPQRFVNNPQTLQILIVPEGVSLERLETNKMVEFEINKGIYHQTHITAVVSYDYDKSIPLDIYGDVRDYPEYFNGVDRECILLGPELFKEFKNTIFIDSHFARKKIILLGGYKDTMVLDFNIMYLDNPDDILEIIKKYFTIMKVYKTPPHFPKDETD